MNILLARFWGITLIFVVVCTNSSWAFLSGRLLVGTDGDFSSLSQALDSVAYYGLDGDLELTITPGQQIGPFTIGNYAGSSSFTLALTPFEGGPVTLVSADTALPTLQVFNGANLQFSDIYVQSPTVVQPAVRIWGSSANLLFTGCSITARSTSRAVEILGPDVQNVTLIGCTIRRASDAVFLDGYSTSAFGNSIVNCVIDSVQQGVSVSRQTLCRITGCDIKPNLGLGSGATAVNIGTQNPSDSVLVISNSLSQIKTGSGYAVAIRHNPLSSQAFLQASNNFIYGFQNTGSSQVRAIFVSGGQNRLVNNSILVNDVAATGTAYSLYNGLIAPDASLTLLNNILANQEATRPAYNAFMLTQAAPIVSNNNLFYGTGTAYKVGWLINPFTTLAEWQTTGLDLSSYSGNPLFVSNSDLHLQQSSALPHQNGAVALDVTSDIDGQLRFQPPDIGADEYLFDAPASDVAILNVLGMPQSFPEYSLLRLEVVVQNRGSSPVLDLPLRLTYDDTARAEALISLIPSQADTFLLLWSTDSAHTTSELIVETILGTDANPSDNAVAFNLAVTGLPMSGTYQIGGFGADFPTLSTALNELNHRGVDGPVVLNLEAGLYPENLTLENVSGLNSVSTLTIQQSPFSEGIVQISPPGSQPSVLLSNVSYVTIEGLILQGSGATLETMKIANNSHHNVIRNCHLACASQDQSSATTLLVSTGCSDNLFQQLDINTAYTGLRFEGASGQSSAGNIVRDCNISGVRTSIQASWQQNLLIENCSITAGFANAPSPCYGIRVLNLSPPDTVRVLNNRITQCLAAGTITAISAESGAGVLFAANNWIGDFNSLTSGAVVGLSATSGTALFYHNTVSIGDLLSSNITGISVSGTQTAASLLNNIIQITDPQAIARFIEWTGGVIAANHNLYDGPGTNTQFRFGHSNLDGDYQTLSAWSTATGQDSASTAAPAGFQSPVDFHLRPDAAGPSNRGLYIPAVAFDADGEPRDSTPDIGVDEFVYQAAVIDLAVQSVGIPWIPAPANTLQQLFSVVGNVGQSDITGAQATLYFNEDPVDSQLFSIAHGTEVELLWNWSSPEVELAYGSIRVSAFAPGDAVAANDSKSQSIVISGAPLSDSVFVGGSRSSFGTLAELSEHLRWRGIAGELYVLLGQQAHQGPLVLNAIPGADSLRHVIIESLDPIGTTITAANSEAVVLFHDADFIELRQLGITAEAGTAIGISLDNTSCNNVIDRCVVTGSGSGDLGTVGIRVSGSDCHGNTITGNTVSACYIGVSLTSANSQISHGNIVSGNDISDVYYGVWVDHQHEALISGNDIRPGSNVGPAGACYGVYIVQIGENGSLRVDGNKIHGFLDGNGPRTNRACGVYSAPGITSSVEIVNNFIYGYSQLTSLRSRGIYLSSGNHVVANNSIRLDDSPADNETSGVFVSTGTQHEIYNNCVMVYENDVPSYGLDIEVGADVISDYNCLWGNSTNFRFAGLGTQNYASLASWQATGQDAQSLNLHVSYISSTDLHIQPTDSTMFAQGIALQQVSTDIDGDSRPAVPCIGADEYVLQSVLTPPLGLSIAVTAGTEIQLNWYPVNGASHYLIYGATSFEQLELSPVELGSTTSTNWTWDFDADPNNLRFFNVRAE